MVAETKIEWTDHTFNPWWGCQRVSPACEHCYAEAFSHRIGGSPWAKGEHWGPRGLRTIASQKQWAQPLAWNAAAEKAGERRRVFCASMADVFEDRLDLAAPRARLFELIERTPWLDWLLLTKRPEGIHRLIPERWHDGCPPNVWLGTTVESQRYADERIPHMLEVPAAVHFLSMEPLLGAIDLDEWVERIDHCNACDAENEPHEEDHCPACGRDGTTISTWGFEQADRYRTGERYDPESAAGRADVAGTSPTIDWVIVGGESSPGARPLDLVWARSLVGQCRAAGVACFVKQLGARPEASRTYGDPPRESVTFVELKSKKGGDPAEWPEDLRVREFPEVRDGE